MELSTGGAKIRLLLGDITAHAADVIVSAANPELVGGSGVDGAIHRAGGPSLMIELNRLRPRHGCPPGSGVMTKAGALPARAVFHAVGPVWRGGGFGEAELLRDAFTAALKAAAEQKAASISFPALSTGAYGYPMEKAAPVALDAVARFLLAERSTLTLVQFVLFDRHALLAFERALKALEARLSQP